MPLTLDNDGLLRRGDGWIALTEHQIALLRPLLHELGQPVSMVALTRAYVDAGGASERTAVRRALSRLRSRVRPLDVELHLLAGRAALLEDVRSSPS